MYSVTGEIVAWLTTLGFAASTRVRDDAPSEFVTVERTGGGITNMVDHPTVAVQTWAKSEARAEDIANIIRAATIIGNLPHGVSEMRPTSGPYPFYDNNTRSPRMQTVYNVTCWVTSHDSD